VRLPRWWRTGSRIRPDPAGAGLPGSKSSAGHHDGREFDVLSFNVEAARALLGKTGLGRLEITYHYPILPENRERAEMLQQQWLHNLGIRLKLVGREFNAHWSMVLGADYSGVAEYAFLPTYFDPNPFLDPFAAAGNGNPMGWFDTGYKSLLDEANRTSDRKERMARLSICEHRLLEAMPLIPLFFDIWAYLRKPFVRGLTSNLFDTRAWIDTNWRPS
jgi:oligopeptide transport system substrate-binding protein